MSWLDAINPWILALMVLVTIALCAVWEHAGYERRQHELEENYKREGFGPDT